MSDSEARSMQNGLLDATMAGHVLDLELLGDVLDDQDVDRVTIAGIGPGDEIDLVGWVASKDDWFERPQRFSVAGTEGIFAVHVVAGVVDGVRLVLRWASALDRHAQQPKRTGKPRSDPREPWDYLGKPRTTKNGVRSAFARGYFRLDVAESMHFEIDGQPPRVDCRYQLYRVAERYPSRAERERERELARDAQVEAILDRAASPEAKRPGGRKRD